jgi:hypothetical protein
MDEDAPDADPPRGMDGDVGRFDRVSPADEEERFRALDYEVDAEAVAAAIVARMLAGRLPPPWR